MPNREPFRIDPRWTFSELLDHVFDYYVGSGIQSTGYRLNAIRGWLSMVGRERAIDALAKLELEAGTTNESEIAKSLWMTASSYKRLKLFVKKLPSEHDVASSSPRPIKAFISYKWESGEHVAWVRRLAVDLRSRGIEAILDQWEVRYGQSFTDYMQQHIAQADLVLFIITPGSVAAAEAPNGKGGAVKFEVQMMNARRIAEGTKIIGVYRSGDRPPHYLRDNRYADFRDDAQYDSALSALVEDLLGRAGPPPVKGSEGA